MNKTVTVNISGFVFYIEEGAYTVLSTYLNRIKSIFKSDEGGDEIVSDVEARIAELFKEKLGVQKEVVVMSDVEEVIQTMGKPEDYMDDSTMNQSNTESSSNAEETFSYEKKKIYRDPDDKQLGGVCSGLAHYFDIDPILLRIAFIILVIAGGSGILLYVILWIVIPKAQTTAEKLRMKGEKINLENIKKKVDDFSKDSGIGREDSGLTKAANGLGEILTGAFRILGKVIQVFLSVVFGLIAIGLLIGMIVLLISPDSMLNISNSQLSIDEIKQIIFHGSTTFYFLVFGGILLALTPIVALIYWSIRLLTGSNYRSSVLSYSLLSLFIIGIVITTIGGVKMARNMAYDGEDDQIHIVSGNDFEQLNVSMLPDDEFDSNILWDGDDSGRLELFKLKDGKLYNGALISIKTKRSPTNDYQITVIKRSQGSGKLKASEFARNINYNINIEDSLLEIAPYFTTNESFGFRGQHVEVQIAVPDGKKISFDQNTDRVHTDGFVGGQTYLYDNKGYPKLYDEYDESDEQESAEVITDNKK